MRWFQPESLAENVRHRSSDNSKAIQRVNEGYIERIELQLKALSQKRTSIETMCLIFLPLLQQLTCTKLLEGRKKLKTVVAINYFKRYKVLKYFFGASHFISFRCIFPLITQWAWLVHAFSSHPNDSTGFIRSNVYWASLYFNTKRIPDISATHTFPWKFFSPCDACV